MFKFGISLITIIFCLLLSACGTLPKGKQENAEAPDTKTSKKSVEYNAVLTDPIIKKEFHQLVKAAMSAPIYNKEGTSYLSESDIKKLNSLSANLIDRLQNHYHLDPSQHKIHTFIGRNQLDSCFTYYDSIENNIGKDCHSFADNKNCEMCDEFVNKIYNRNQKIISFRWHDNDVTMLVDKFRLRNGDRVYLGLMIAN